VASEADGWVRASASGALLRVRVIPRAARAGIAGVRGQALSVRLTAPPVEGAANRELVTLLARALAVRPAAVAIAAGAGSRDKRIRVEGLGPETVRARLGAALSVDRPTRHD